MVTKYSDPLGPPGALRKVHRSLALQEIYRHPGSSRREIADRLGLSKMAIGRIVQDLKDAGLLREVSIQTPASGRGRPHMALELQTSGAYVIGAVVSGFSQQIVALNVCGDVVASCDVEFSDISDGPLCVHELCEQIHRFVAVSQLPADRIVGAGFACAVGVDSDNGRVTGGSYLGWTVFDFKGLASSKLGLPVNLVNIADALLRAETFFGFAQDTSSVVLVHCSTGLAASFWSGGKLFKGAQHRSGRL
ncbi:MAG: ROK family transcriptional regulator, partial [Gammaproteobacteria bacterium]